MGRVALPFCEAVSFIIRFSRQVLQDRQLKTSRRKLAVLAHLVANNLFSEICHCRTYERSAENFPQMSRKTIASRRPGRYGFRSEGSSLSFETQDSVMNSRQHPISTHLQRIFLALLPGGFWQSGRLLAADCMTGFVAITAMKPKASWNCVFERGYRQA